MTNGVKEAGLEALPGAMGTLWHSYGKFSTSFRFPTLFPSNRS